MSHPISWAVSVNTNFITISGIRLNYQNCIPPSSDLTSKGEENETKYSQSSNESEINPNRSSDDSQLSPKSSKYQNSLFHDHESSLGKCIRMDQTQSENQQKSSEKNPTHENNKIHPFPLIRSDPVVASSTLESYLINSQSKENTEISSNSEKDNDNGDFSKGRINVKEEFQGESSKQGNSILRLALPQVLMRLINGKNGFSL